MRIRSASLADAAALTRLWQESGLRFLAADVPAELAAVLARDGDLVLVAEDADGLAAAVLGTFDGRRGWVNRLAARPDRRGQGLATAILAELERRLSAKGCRKVNLLIEPDNQAVTGFYRQHGYAEDELIFMEKWLLQLRAIESARCLKAPAALVPSTRRSLHDKRKPPTSPASFAMNGAIPGKRTPL
jgi:ribosomal protein S18 acetylase RimI-like enzyme